VPSWGEFHPDPADRIIIATALENAAAIITPDDRIRTYPHVQSAW
jgi:PIN domain nuclease of toxin-antitoxin system